MHSELDYIVKFRLIRWKFHFLATALWRRSFHQLLQEASGMENHGKPLTLVVTHPLPPLAGFVVRNLQLAHIAKARQEWGPDVIVSGDLNISSWSPYFQDLVRESGLRDSQLGFGVQPSWPAGLLPVMRIPIDHVLVSENFVVLKRELGPDIGSDHLPVYVELGLKE